MTQTELVIFDCDGVLVDTERHLQAVDLRLIAELGWPITVEEILTEHLGRSTSDVLANIELHIGRPLPDDFRSRRKRAFYAATQTGLDPIPGVFDAIDSLLRSGYLVCVASSGSPEAITDSLTRSGLQQRFGTNIFSGHQVADGKPAPDLFLHAARAMKTDPARCIVIEDSPSGVAAARTARIRVIGFARSTPAGLLDQADLIVVNMHDLLGAIHQLEHSA